MPIDRPLTYTVGTARYTRLASPEEGTMHGEHAALIRKTTPRTVRPNELTNNYSPKTYNQAASGWTSAADADSPGTASSMPSLPGVQHSLSAATGTPHLRRHETVRHLVICDAAALPFRSGTFNLVTASMVAEHLEHPEAVFREVARVSAPGARFIVFTPNKWNYAMVVSRWTPHWFHVFYKRLAYYLNRGEWRSFEDDVFPTWYRANTVSALRSLRAAAGLREVQTQRLSLAHSFGFVKPLYILSLLFERLVDRLALDVLKADILAVFEKPSPRSLRGEESGGLALGQRT